MANKIAEESLVKVVKDEGLLINFLKRCIVFCVMLLAVLMVIVIIFAIVDVIMHLYNLITAGNDSTFDVENLIETLGGFLAVLIAIEIFLNIIFYLKESAVHVPLVLSTALTAVARKVIILDYKDIDVHYIYATAAAIFSIGIIYWLVTKKD